MADTVRLAIEAMLPELQDLIRKKIFNQSEIKTIVKKRTIFENKLKSRGSNIQDYLRYIEYEYKLEQLRKKRICKFGQDYKPSYCDWSIPKHIHHLFNRAITKAGQGVTVEIWQSYITMCKKLKSYTKLTHIYARALQFHARNLHLWLEAAQWEFQVQANPISGRKLLQRAVHINSKNCDLSHLLIEWFRMECAYVTKIRLRLLAGTPTNESEGQELHSIADTLLDDDLDDKDGNIMTESVLNQTYLLNNDLVVQYAVPNLIYQYLVTHHPTNIQARHTCLTIAYACPDSKLVDMIIDSIMSDRSLARTCMAQVMLASWKIYPSAQSVLKVTDLEYSSALHDAVCRLDQVVDCELVGEEEICVRMEIRHELMVMLLSVLTHVGGVRSVLGPYIIEQIKVHLINYLGLVECGGDFPYTLQTNGKPDTTLLLPATWLLILNIVQHKPWNPIPLHHDDMQCLLIRACTQYPTNIDLVIERIAVSPTYLHVVTDTHSHFSQNQNVLDLINVYKSVLKRAQTNNPNLQSVIPKTLPEFQKVWKRFRSTGCISVQNLDQFAQCQSECLELWYTYIQTTNTAGGNNKVLDEMVEWMMTFVPLDQDSSSLLLGKGSIPMQRQVFEKLVAVNPYNVQIWIAYINMLVTQDQDQSGAAQVYQRAVTLCIGSNEMVIPELMEGWTRIMDVQKQIKI